MNITLMKYHGACKKILNPAHENVIQQKIGVEALYHKNYVMN